VIYSYPNTRIWDPGKLEGCFLPWEAELVGRILVSEGWDEDILIWPLTSDGEYGVQSTYRMLVEVEKLALQSSSSSVQSQDVWKKIWKLQVPNKIRHFLWRAAKNSLPTKMNLKARHILVDDTCDDCGDHAESIMHCLWLCDQSRSVWLSDPGFGFLAQKKFRFFVEILEALFSEGSAYRCALFATVAWGLWQRQNRVRVHQPSWSLHDIRDRAKELVQEFWNVHQREPQGPTR